MEKRNGPERSLEVNCSNCGAKFTAYYDPDEEVVYTVHVSSCALCHGDPFKRDSFKGCTIRLLAEVTRERTMTPSLERIAHAKSWQATTSYELGDRAAIHVDGEVFVLVCIQPGKSAITMPDLPRLGVRKSGMVCACGKSKSDAESQEERFTGRRYNRD
jgi:hypothetical protein